MENDYDSCGLQPAIELKANDMIKNFNRYYKPGDLRRDLRPWGVFLSKKYLEDLLSNMEADQNCVELRLGLVEPPHDGLVHVVWMLRPLHAEVGDATEPIRRTKEGTWNISEYKTVPTEPVVMKDPQGEQ